MDTNPRVLRNALITSLAAVDNQIEAVKFEASELDTLPSRIRDTQGNFLLTPLLCAQAQILHSLTLLQTKEK